MVIVNQGLTIFRDACKAECVTGIAGTGTTTPSSTQTALTTEVVAVAAAVSITNGTFSWQTTHTIPSTLGTGSEYAEWGTEDGDGTMIHRAVTSGVNHTSADELTKITTFNIVDR